MGTDDCLKSLGVSEENEEPRGKETMAKVSPLSSPHISQAYLPPSGNNREL